MTDAESYLAAAGIEPVTVRLMEEMGYFTQPASKSHHLACPGGLAQHSANVTRRLVELTKSLDVRWTREQAPYLVGMLHDLVKCKCYRAMGEMERNLPPKYEYVQPEYPGHGACSVAIATELGIQLMREEIAAIAFHMGPWGVGKEYADKELDAALKAYGPQIIATHTADWWACCVDEREDGARRHGGHRGPPPTIQGGMSK